MSSLAFLVPAAACAVAGAALYVTRGALDQVNAGGSWVRLALLPPWEALAGFTCLAGLVVLGIAHLNAPRGTTSGRRPPLRALVVPLLVSGVLLVPYLPWLPDRLPVLQALAGPLRGVVWLVVAALQAWTLWQARRLVPRWLARRSIGQLAVAIGVATSVVGGAAAARLMSTPAFPAGDEPHYLVIAQSLWRDGDLRIENNHERGDYREYFRGDLEPDYLTRGRDQAIYSIHPVGLPALVAPVLAAGGYPAVVLLLVAIAAIGAAVAWRWIVAALNAPGAATFAWAAVVLSAPFLFNAVSVYPEIAAGAVVMAAVALAQGSAGPPAGRIRWLGIGLACAALPWLSTKYAPMSAAVLLVALARMDRDPRRWPARAAAAWLVVPYLVSLAAWSAFFFVIWGSPLPTAPYGSMTQTSPLNLGLGVPGLLFDQEYGLLAYAPVYVLAATGLVALWRGGNDLRRRAIEIGLIVCALVATVGAHRLWWGGSAAPARPLGSILLLLALPIAAAFRAAPAASARRAGQHALLWLSAGVTLTMSVAENGLLVATTRDGTSALLAYWSPRWEAWSLAPSFVSSSTPIALLHAAVWVAAAAAAAWVLARLRTTDAGAAALAAAGVLGVAVAGVAIVMPWLPADPPPPRVDLGARSHLAVLDRFDLRSLPASVVFDPLRKTSAADVQGLMRLGAAPGQRRSAPPLRVLHNGRFSLPAGRYRIEAAFAGTVPGGAATLSLQVGRIGLPLGQWSVEPRPGARWTTDVWLPVDAGFVGLRGTPDLERAIEAISVVPIAIVDRGDRREVGEVLSASRVGAATVFAHDEQIWQQPPAIWTHGGRRTSLTIAADPGRTTPIVLRVSCGARPNAAVFRAHGWERRVALVPGTPRDVVLPAVVGGIVSLTIDTESGFLPWQIDPASRDRRMLGVWIEVVAEP